MRNLLRILAAAMLLILFTLSVLPVFAETDGTQTEDGYDRGYAGGKNGDGKLYAHGIDISVWQGDSFNFTAAKAAGLSYVIIRAGVTYEKDGAYVTEIDEHFEKNYEGAKAAGLDVGVYFYSMARNVDEALAEADALLSYLDGKLLEYPVYMDFEAPAVRTYLESDAAKAKEICKAFMDKMSDEGYLVGLYSSASWIDSGSYNGWMSAEADELGEKYELWVACYFNDGTYDQKGAEYSKRFGMYQYTSSKYIDGYGGRLDANICYKDYPSIVKKYGFNGYEPDESIEVGATWITEESKFRLGFYTVSSSNSKVGVYNEPDYDSGAVGYIANGSSVEVVEACAVWGENWARIEVEEGVFGWIEGSNLKGYRPQGSTEPPKSSETEKPSDDQSDSSTDPQGSEAPATSGGCGASLGVGIVAAVGLLTLGICGKKKNV